MSSKEEFIEKMQKRHQDLQAKQKQRDDERNENRVENERSDYRMEMFHSDSRRIEQSINELSADAESAKSESKIQMIEKLDNIQLDIQKLQQFFTDSTIYLSSYKIKLCQEAIGKLTTLLNDKRASLAPRKKFAFKAKKPTENGVEIAVPAQSGKTGTGLQPTVTGSQFQFFNDYGFKDEEGKELSLSREDLLQREINLFNLKDCTVKLLGSPGTVHIREMKNCTVLCGPVCRSVFVHDSVNCKFVVACQQLRIHTSTECQFYIHVTSRAIIEECEKVYFAPYALTYDGLDQDYEVSGLQISKNSWNDIDDFDWLAKDRPSPNWSLLPESERITWNL